VAASLRSDPLRAFTGQPATAPHAARKLSDSEATSFVMQAPDFRARSRADAGGGDARTLENERNQATVFHGQTALSPRLTPPGIGWQRPTAAAPSQPAGLRTFSARAAFINQPRRGPIIKPRAGRVTPRGLNVLRFRFGGRCLVSAERRPFSRVAAKSCRRKRPRRVACGCAAAHELRAPPSLAALNHRGTSRCDRLHRIFRQKPCSHGSPRGLGPSSSLDVRSTPGRPGGRASSPGAAR
jgi:hypothetical protein